MANFSELPEGIFSLLDTDLYKLTMQCAILKYLPKTRSYLFHGPLDTLLRPSRGHIRLYQPYPRHAPQPSSLPLASETDRQHVSLPQKVMNEADTVLTELVNIQLTLDELQYLRTTCTYFNDSYLQFLSSFRLQPSHDVKLTWIPLTDTGGMEDSGDLHIEVGGLWLHTILYEIPLLALTSEAYFKFCDKDWNHDGQEEKAFDKGLRLLEHGCIFSEFGTRRRRDYHTHDLVMRGLIKAAKTSQEKGWEGNLTGTSNVHMAMKYGVAPVGTVAHEWFMGIASITNDYVHANEIALRYWVGSFGEGVLGIALTDTFGTPSFLKAFRKSMPTKIEAELNTIDTTLPQTSRPAIEPTDGVIDIDSTTDTLLPPSSSSQTQPQQPKSYAETFTGVRQDSGDPITFIQQMRTFYNSLNIHTPKTIVFSDSLNISLCLTYKAIAEEYNFVPTFGIGTFFTNDFSCTLSTTDPGRKSSPMNIVIKLSSANGRPAIKISDNVGKNMGDESVVRGVKETLGYVERRWEEGDERRRWGGGETGPG